MKLSLNRFSNYHSGPDVPRERYEVDASGALFSWTLLAFCCGMLSSACIALWIVLYVIMERA